MAGLYSPARYIYMFKYSLKKKRANAQGGAQDSGCRHRASPKEDLNGLLLKEDHWQSCHVGSLHARLVSMIPHFKSMPQLSLRQRKPSAADQRQQQHALPAQPVALAVVCGSLRCIKLAALRGFPQPHTSPSGHQSQGVSQMEHNRLQQVLMQGTCPAMSAAAGRHAMQAAHCRDAYARQ